MSRTLKATLLLVVVTFIWGSTFVLVKKALEDVSPLLLNALRMTVAFLGLAVVYRRDLRELRGTCLRDGILVGFFLYLGYSFQTAGLKLTTPSKSAFLTGVSVVLVPVLLAVAWRRLVRAWTAVGVATAFVGLYLLTVPVSASGQLLDFSSINRGDELTMGCALAFAFQIILLGRAMQHHRFQPIALAQVGVAAIFTAATVPLVEEPFVNWSWVVILAVLVTGLLATAFAFTAQAWAQQFLAPTLTALIFALEPVFAWLTSYLVLGERLGFRAAVGAILILAGVVVSELKGAQAELKVEVGNDVAPTAPAEPRG